ncbi:hypothetical protein [Bacillus sp. OK048]|uniref:hypothetical protein n=1 Tax=Bacillus sp. OK048 TaxID=1882761 RepID=UPI00088D36F0|nr:hypothetical protein [Bacillus sp. OK048]SDL98245.1 hypothetical protein SAMN05443253_101367 [Bacillus sp. OK048]
MNFHLAFKIENNPYRFIHITHLLSKTKCKLIDFNAKQIDNTNLLSIHVSLQGERRMYNQLVHILNNSVGVIDICFEKEKLAAI